MKVKVLESVEALTPSEMAERAGVPLEWLITQIRENRISYVQSAWMPLFASTDAEKIKAKYKRYRQQLREARASSKARYAAAKG